MTVAILHDAHVTAWREWRHNQACATSAIRYARGANKYDAHPEVREVSDFAAFERAVLADRARTKGQQYVCAPFKVNGDGRAHRGMAEVELRRFLALDVDRIAGAETFADLRLWFVRFHGFGYTTASHTPEAPRCRVIIELDREIDRNEGMRLGAAIARDLGAEFGERVALDVSTHRGEQPCYLPVIQSEPFQLDGDPLDVDQWLDGVPQIEPERKGSAAIGPDDDPVIVALKERGMYRRGMGAGKHAICCPWAAEHTTVDDTQSSATCYLQPHHQGFVTAGFKCQHEHCAGRKGDDLLAFLGVDWRMVKDAYKPMQGAPERDAPHASAADYGMHHEPDPDAPPRDPDARDGTPANDSKDWPAALDLEILAEREPQPPQSIMEGLPCGYATGTFGHGGAGKSQIELLRAVCIAAGVPFCGLQVVRRRVLFISCEDRADILHWRLTRICAHLGVNLTSLRGWLEVIDLVGHASILFAPDARTGRALTPAYGELEQRMRQYESEVLVLDGITDTFGGNENARGDVKHYVNALLALIPADTGALILVGHVNKATAGGGTGEGYSGSTAWHNSVRARWYLRPETVPGEDGEPAERTGKLLFELQKSNHGEVGAQIAFEWNEEAHLFIGRAKSASEFDRRHRDRMEQEGILRALRACGESVPPIIVPAAMQGPRTAFLVLSQRPELPESLRTGKPAKSRFWRQIERLRQIHAIDESSYRRSNRHLINQISLTTEGARQCAAF